MSERIVNLIKTYNIPNIIRDYQRGEIIFTSGEEASNLVLIRSGVVREETTDIKGVRRIWGYYPEGLFLGLEALMGSQRFPKRRERTLVAASNSIVTLVPADEFRKREIRAGRLGLELSFTQEYLRDIQVEHEKMRSYDSVLTRTARALVLLSEVFRAAELYIKQVELAAYTHHIRESTSRALSHLEMSGMILAYRGKIQLYDIDALAAEGQVESLADLREKFIFHDPLSRV